MSDVRLRYRRQEEAGEVACASVDEAIDLAAEQIDSGELWPTDVLVDGRVVLPQEELLEAARLRLGEDDDDRG